MTTFDDLRRFYTCVMSCQNTPKECPSISLDKEINPVPRGFYFEESYSEDRVPSYVKILVVAKNPSHPQEDEKMRYVNKKELELVDAHLTFMSEMFKKRTSIFHRNLLRYLSKILNLCEDEIFIQAAFTNLVKCSTTSKQARIDDKTMEVCFEKFFLKELRFFKPDIILALGRETEKFLKKQNDQNQLGIPTRCIVYVKHPRYSMGQREDEELGRVKKDFFRFHDCNECASKGLRIYYLTEL